MQNSIKFNTFVHTTKRANKLNANNTLVMINDIIPNIINDTLNSFDIPFCISVNIGTYLVIKTIEDINKNIISNIWSKRVVLLIVSIIIAAVYYINGSDCKTILNSVILAPVSWSWIFKPICAKLKIDYKNTDINN